MVEFVNLHNPYFSDRAPTVAANQGSNYTFAPAPSRIYGIEGDVALVPFTVLAASPQKLSVSVKVLNGSTIVTTAISLLRARDVRVEGNSFGNCACAAGQLPQKTSGGSEMICTSKADASELQIPAACPTAVQREKIAATLVRDAPFTIKDPLEPLMTSKIDIHSHVTELFIAKIPITSTMPKGDLDVSIMVVDSQEIVTTISVKLRVLKLKLDKFPTADLSYWLSEDPRDLVARPNGTPLNGRWGGDWWSDEHWRNLERAAKLQVQSGVTNVLVPLFVRNPFGIDAKSLVSVRCITGSKDIPKDFGGYQDSQSPFNDHVAGWNYDFDFTNFQRFVSLFKNLGFRNFEGAHLMGNSGVLPVLLECDLYHNRDDEQPYVRNFRFMPREGSPDEAASQKKIRVGLYQKNFLPLFLSKLRVEIKKADIEKVWYQHVIDENAPNDEAIAAYADIVSIIRKKLPYTKTIDAINQYTGPRYSSLIDLPVLHLALLYDDQMKHKNIFKEIANAFPGRKYFYNTALREGGPNRFLDTNPMENRVYGWLETELGYDGMLYWASNFYRYPSARDMITFRRPDNWSPFNYAHGPYPNGYIAPGLAAGANWDMYPTEVGLIGSLRALRLRDGLLDHWIYKKAIAACQVSTKPTCKESLATIKQQLTGDSSKISDYSRDPKKYDNARELLLSLIEK